MRIFWSLFHLSILILSLPLQGVVALVVWVSSGSPVIFSQKRVGRNERSFVLYKFRTMVPNADKMKRQLSAYNETDGPAFKIHDDPRFTPVGKLLSHVGLDELPQLWNVVRGDMALFGPRPLPVSEAAKIAPRYRSRYDVAPGILSPWVLNGYHRRTFVEWMDSDVSYARTKSPLTDLVLLFRTLPFMVYLWAKELTDGQPAVAGPRMEGLVDREP